VSAPAFTAGPWSFEDLKQKHPRFGIVTAKNIIVARSWIEPDARLIAAAPELYAQLERAAGMLEMVSLQDHRNAACASRELLAKARGEQ
jgi:hypothetical protein